MKTVYILFYRGIPENKNASWIDLITSWWTKGMYSHVELAVEYDSESNIYVCYSASPRDGKVRRKNIKFNHEHWDIKPIKVTDEEYNRIIEFYDNILGQPYDWPGILGFILPVQDRTNKWFCSESVSNALKITGWKPMWKIDPSNVSPNRLAILADIPIAYKVRLIDVFKRILHIG